MTESQAPYPCPACGYLVFERPPGSNATCPVCEWVDDAEQLEFATTAGGANDLTLFEVQRAGAPVRPEYMRDESWRPIDLNVDDFEDCHDPNPRRARGAGGKSLYYWRRT